MKFNPMKNIQGSIHFKPIFCLLNPCMQLEVYPEPSIKKKKTLLTFLAGSFSNSP